MMPQELRVSHTGEPGCWIADEALAAIRRAAERGASGRWTREAVRLSRRLWRDAERMQHAEALRESFRAPHMPSHSAEFVGTPSRWHGGLWTGD